MKFVVVLYLKLGGNMNEKKKALIIICVLGILLVMFVSIVIMSWIQSERKIEEIENIIKSEKTQIIYLAKPTCYYCNLIEPITTSLQEEFDLEYFHINTEELSNSELTKVLKMIGVDLETFGTPYIAIVENGELIDQQIGYTDEDVLFSLFKEHGLIEESATLNMNYIDSLDTVWNQDESKLVLIGESGDTASIDARIQLRELAKTYNFEINYFDASKLIDNTEYTELLNMLGVNKLPVLVVVKNGNILMQTTDANYEKFLKENNYIK